MDAKRFFTVSMLCILILCAMGCAQYDSHRITQTKQHKQNYVEDVQRALEGKLTKREFESSLQSMDASMLEEEGKNSAEGVTKLKSALDDTTKKAITDTFGE